MKTRSVAVNAVLNVLRTVLALIGPLITYPYVSRVLEAENLGKVNYVNSIIQYFILISSLGISTYAVREGARKRQDSIKVNNFISECFTINFIMAVISLTVLSIIVINVPGLQTYKTLFFIEAFLVIFDLLGIEWVNTIYEDYLYITMRTILIYAVNIVSIFVFIHVREDYYKYAVISVGTTGLVSVLNWFHCRKKCKIKFRISTETKKHVKPILVFFANKLAVTVYVSLDTTMIGAFASDYRVGIYSVAVKIYTIIKNMIAAMYAVCIPRLAALVGTDDNEGYKALYSDIVSVVAMLVLPASVGVMMLAPNIILLMFGNEYMESIVSLEILSIGIIFAILGGLVSSVFNVTRGYEKISLQATILAAVVNTILNYMFIPLFQEKAAAATTVLAELVAFLYCLLRADEIREFIDVKKIAKNFGMGILGSCVTVSVSSIIKLLDFGDILTVVATIVGTVGIYLVILLATKNEYIKIVYQMIKDKIRKE